MISHRFNSSVSQSVLILLSFVFIADCSVSLPPRSFQDQPLFKPIKAKMGVYHTGPARTHTYISPLLRIKFGELSVSRLDQIFSVMFSEIVEVPDWPPWREGGLNVDAVIELRKVDLTINLGNDLDQPDVINVAYQICLFKPDGTVVNCWSPGSDIMYQRRPFECLDLGNCISQNLEGAVRDASARFMLEFEQDPLVREWANSLKVKTSD